MPSVLVFAVAIRLVVFFAFPSVFDFATTGVIHGSDAYDAYARNLLATGVYGRIAGVPDAELPPLYGIVLAGLYRTAGRGAIQVVLMHTVFDLVTIAAIWQIGRRIMPVGEAAGSLAALFTAGYPYLVFQSLTVVDTSLFVALLFSFLLVSCRLPDARTGSGIWTLGALAGIALGLGMLTRPILPPLLVVVAIWWALRAGVPAAARRLVPVVVTAVLVLAPWTARNLAVFGRLVPMTTNAGSNFWQGNNPDSARYLRAGYDVQWIPGPPIRAADRHGPDASREFFELGFRYWREHPAEIPYLLWTKFLVHWSLDVAPHLNPSAAAVAALEAPGSVAAQDEAGRLTLGGLSPTDAVSAYSRPLFDRYGRWVHRLSWGSLFALGLIGVVVTWRHWRSVSLLWGVQIAMTAVYVAFHPSTRYRAPSDPAWFLFSAAAVLWLLGSRRVSDTGEAP
jgi:hypothetical protein